MPIPAPGTAWPPAEWAEAYAVYRENNAWLTGDTDELAAIYQRATADRATHTRRGKPMRGGLVGAASRMFWGQPVPAGENRSRLHVPAAADLATLASDLVFAEPPKVHAGEDTDSKIQARLDMIANSDESTATFQQMGELKSAFGSAVLVSRWDLAVADHVWLEAAAADVVIPEFRSGRMIAVTLWTEYRDSTAGTVWRHLEHHAPGYIEHALYQGTDDNLGRRVPLQERPETAPLAEVVNADSVILTGIDRLTASWNPNMQSMAWRKKGDLAYAGRSDFAQLPPLFDLLDETWSSWMRDLRQGAGKVLVPEAAIEFGGVGQGGTFDTGREYFQGLNLPGDPDKLAFDKVQFDIRVEEHERTARGIMREILRKAGFSQSAWGDDSANAQMTATEIHDRRTMSERTRDKKILRDRQAIARQASVALELDGLLFPGKGGGRLDVAPTVEFVDISQEDPTALAQTLSLLDAAGAISTEQKVRRANPEWTEAQVLDEVAAIRAERAPDPATFTGLPEDDPLD